MTPQLLPCPACERVTALWGEVRPTDRLRCPHCGYEALYEQLSPIPHPSWQVVGTGAGSGVAEEDVDWLAGRQTIDATAPPSPAPTENRIDPSAQTVVDLQGKYEGLSLTAPSEQFSCASATADVKPAAVGAVAAALTGDRPIFQSRTSSRLERQRRQTRPSPLWSVVQVVLGGVAAIPIGLLLVWHVVGVDVGGAAAAVARYVPWIVPQELRPYQPPEEFNWQPQPPRSGLPAAGVEPFADAELDVPPNDNSFALIRQATEHLQAWSVAAHDEDADLKSLARSTYGDLTDLALELEKLPAESSLWRTVRRQLNPLGKLVLGDAQVQRLISEGSRYWVTNQVVPAAEGDSNLTAKAYGLAALVTVESAEKVVDAEPAHWAVTVSSASRLGDPPLQMHIPVDVALGLVDGRPVPEQQLFVLGVVQRGKVTTESDQQPAPSRDRFVASYAIGLAE